LGNILNGPWKEYTGNCGGDFGGLNDNMYAAGTITLKPNDPYHIVLSSYSRMRVAGLRKWKANARVHSSYRLAGILRKQTNSGSDFGEHCCSPASAMYSMSTISEDVVSTSGVTFESYLDATEVFFGLWDINNTLQHAVGTFEGSQPEDCSTDIDFSGTKRLLSDEVSRESSVALSVNGKPVVFLQGVCLECPIAISNLQGQIINYATDGVAQLTLPSNLLTGLYFITLQGTDGKRRTQKFIYTR
jgi:hypothetical protein